jgi:vacuolar-type H+-ATPase subunit H
MQKNVAQAIDAVWDGWFKGVDFMFQSGKQMEQTILESLDHQQQWLTQSAEHIEKVKHEMKQQLEQFRKKAETELQNTLGDDAKEIAAKWMAQLDHITEQLMQIALTPTKEFFNTSQAFYKQTSILLKQFLSQQQSGREEAEKILKSYFEQIKETQKAIVEKAADYSFFK